MDDNFNYNKTYMKAAQIARARVLGAAKNISDSEIAKQFGLSFGGFNRLIATPEYKELEARVLAHVTSKQDAKLDGNMDALTKKFQQNVPLVCQRILDTALQTRDLKASLEAAKTWLKLDPSRTITEAGTRGAGAGAASTPPLPDEVLRQLEEDSANVISEVMGQPVTQTVQ